MKLLNGKTANFFGKSSFFILIRTIAHLILLELKKTANYNIFMRA